MTAPPTPAELHRRNVAQGFVSDPAQFAVAERLTKLQRQLLLAPVNRHGVRRWLPRAFRRPVEPVPGLYLWGGVGRGKTYLMDVFYETLPFADKRRQHFHRFMRRVHDELRRLAGRENPLQAVAQRFAKEARVLCFDEFHVSDIGDAMILAELLAGIFEHGVTLVATSNSAPGRLYEDGLQRRRFLPAIGLLERHMEVVNVDGETDYRLNVLRRDGIYRGSEDAGELLKSFRALSHRPPERDKVLTVNGRALHARYWAEDVVWFDFEAVCAGPRSNDDYIELARLFATVFVHGVPVFDAEKEDQARRFIGLIDEFYDRNVKLLLAAAAPIERLYVGERLTAEFERTRSRISEMQSDEYLRREHRP